MAIDLQNEHVIPCKQAPEYLPVSPRTGKSVNQTTIYRWRTIGAAAPDDTVVFLETLRCGGAVCTSVEALQRFCNRLTGQAPNQLTSRTAAARRKEIGRADKELAAIGIG